MLLEEAIRAGSAVTLQAYGTPYSVDGDEVSTCALGAALVGACNANEVVWNDCTRKLFALFPELRLTVWGNDNKPFRIALSALVVSLNDDYRVSREDIADFIAWLREGGALG